MERLYAFRHVNLLTKGKVGAAVAVGCAAEKDVEAWLGKVMAFSGMDVVGTMSAKGTPCCFVCEPGETAATLHGIYTVQKSQEWISDGKRITKVIWRFFPTTYHIKKVQRKF